MAVIVDAVGKHEYRVKLCVGEQRVRPGWLTHADLNEY